MDNFDEIWSDVTPVQQDDAAESVVAIAYASGYKKLMSIFRAVLKSGEKSQRVIDLTELILDENAANYTLWQYRRQCLYAIESDLNLELNFVDQFSDDNPKNYQIWYHRRAIVDTMNNASREISFCDRVLMADAKNYHCWAHRQYIVKKYCLWDGELERTDILIKEDIRNNSAWNHRWFVLVQGPVDSSNPSVLEREVQYAHSHIKDVQLNESAWNYLRGLVEFFPSLVDSVKTICITVLQDDSISLNLKETTADQTSSSIFGFAIKNPNCFAMSLLAVLWTKNNIGSEIQKAKILYKKLMVIDNIRFKAWKWKLEKLEFLV